MRQALVPTVLYGRARVLCAMSRDGLVPKVSSPVRPRIGAPGADTVIGSVFCGVLTAAVPLGQPADATGTLFAFVPVDVAVLALRRSRPHLARTFLVPLSPVRPGPGSAFHGWTTAGLSAVTWAVFGDWTAVGLVFYFLYGHRRSRPAAMEPAPTTVTAEK